MAVKQEFESRFAKHKDELEWLFMELYHNREGLEVLEREMAEAYNARSAELKALDKARSADPEWYKRGNMFGMTMYTDLFAGNLKELAKKLPYLKEQKLTYLHLMPLLRFSILGGPGLPFGCLVLGFGGLDQTVSHAAGQCCRMLLVVLLGVGLSCFSGYLGLGCTLRTMQGQQIP